MKKWHIPNAQGLQGIWHICPDPDALGVWCETHQTHEIIARVIMAHAETEAEAERLWGEPTQDEDSAIFWIAESMALAAGLEAGDTMPWGIEVLRIGEYDDPDTTPSSC